MSAEEVAANQRWRLVAATAALVAGRGVGQVTARAIAQEAGVSSSTLYRLLGGADGALLATFEAAADALTQAIAGEIEGTGSARLTAACEWAASEPQLAAMLGSGPAVALPDVAAARERLVVGLVDPFVPHLRGCDSDVETLRRLLAAAVLTTIAERVVLLDQAAARRLGGELAARLQ